MKDQTAAIEPVSARPVGTRADNPGGETEARQHFLALDGLRGVAAIAVLVFHRRWLIETISVDHAYLAVDFFFMLSGFVIAFAYGDRLASNRMRFRAFGLIRAVRLAPLIVLGALLGTLALVIRALDEHYMGGVLKAVAALFFAVLALPAPPFLVRQPFATNQPSWSIFYEILANLAYALLARFLNRTALIGIVVTSGACLFYMVAFTEAGLAVGYTFDTLAHGLLRVTFPFFAGVLIFDLHRTGSLPSLGMPMWFLAIVLLAILILPAREDAWEKVILIGAVFVAFPLIVMSGCQREPTGIWKPAARLSAELSYPLYILHYPLLDLLQPIATMMPGGGFGKIAFYLVVISAISLAIGRIFDAPSRARLKRKLIQR